MSDIKPSGIGQIDFKIFDSIINGELRPFLSKYSSEEIIDKLLHEKTIVSFIWTGKEFAPKTEKDSEKLDKFVPEGEIIRISIDEENPDNIGKITRESDEILEPLFDLDIPPPPDKKSEYFLLVIEDEYDDIKRQAQTTLDASDSIEKAKFIAEKRIQQLKNLASQAHLISKQLPSKGKSFTDDADLFVFYVLKTYLIRSILVYEELFQPFLVTKIQDEYDLRSELYDQPHPKHALKSWGAITKENWLKQLFIELNPERKGQKVTSLELDKLSISRQTLVWKNEVAIKALCLGFIGVRTLAAILAHENIYSKSILRPLIERNIKKLGRNFIKFGDYQEDGSIVFDWSESLENRDKFWNGIISIWTKQNYNPIAKQTGKDCYLPLFLLGESDIALDNVELSVRLAEKKHFTKPFVIGPCYIKLSDLSSFLENVVGLPYPPCLSNVQKSQDQMLNSGSETDKTTNNLNPSQKARLVCRGIAEKVWADNPHLTIAAMIDRKEIVEASTKAGGKLYSEKTVRNWIKDLCPDRSPGRPKKQKH